MFNLKLSFFASRRLTDIVLSQCQQNSMYQDVTVFRFNQTEVQ